MSEKRTATWTPGIPELSCEGSIREQIEGGATGFRMTVTNDLWEEISGRPRIAVIDPEGWRAEATVTEVEHQGTDVVLTLEPAGFPCDRCEGYGAPCDLCQAGTIPPHAIQGEWYVEGLGVVDGPGWHRVPAEESLSPPQHVEAAWRPCEN